MAEATVALSPDGTNDGAPPRAMSWGRSSSRRRGRSSGDGASSDASSDPSDGDEVNDYDDGLNNDNNNSVTEKSVYLLLVVRDNKSAVVARVGLVGSTEFVVDDVADGQPNFTAGCWLWQGRGRFALGRSGGTVELYEESGMYEAMGGGAAASLCPDGIGMPAGHAVEVGCLF